MKKKNTSTNAQILTVIFTTLNLLWMSKATTKILNLMTNERYKFILNQNFIILGLLTVLCILVATNMAKGAQSINPRNYFVLFVFLFILVMAYQINYQANYVANSQIVQLIKSYFPIILIILISIFNNINFLDKKMAELTVVIYSTIQGSIGVLQGITRSTIVPVTDKLGNTVVNSIYYANGVSSKEAYFLQNIGSRVRAFGMTDSGLTLGLLCLLSLIIILYNKEKKLIHYVGIVFFIGIIYLTLTRTIMLVAGLILILYLIRKEKYLKVVYNIAFVLQFLIITVAAVVLKSDFGIGIIKNFPTIGSRLEGYIYYFDYYHFDFLHILFGNNNISLSPLLRTNYSLDNESLNIIMDIGVLGLAIVLGIFINLLRKKYIRSFRSKAIYIFLLTFPIFGIGNSVYYFYFSVLSIYLLIKGSNEGKNMDLEKKNLELEN